MPPQGLDLAGQRVAAKVRDKVQGLEQALSPPGGCDVRQVQRGDPGREGGQHVAVRAGICRPVVHLPMQCFHEQLLAQPGPLPRQLSRHPLLECLVRVRQLGERVLGEDLSKGVLGATSPAAAPAAAAVSTFATSSTSAPAAEFERRHRLEERHGVVTHRRRGVYQLVQD
jgi:hypothetical protein